MSSQSITESVATVSWQRRLVRLLPVVAVMLSIAGLLSGFITWVNVGWSPDFMARWGRAYATALPVLPVGLTTVTLLQRVLRPWLKNQPTWLLNVVLALCSAVTMETLISSAVTYSTFGLHTGFAGHWAKAFIGSLPLGIVIGLIMSFFIRPHLVRWMRAA